MTDLNTAPDFRLYPWPVDMRTGIHRLSAMAGEQDKAWGTDGTQTSVFFFSKDFGTVKALRRTPAGYEVHTLRCGRDTLGKALAGMTHSHD